MTLKDIAESVGKSVAAVSRALNGYDDISPETRAAIKQVAQEMGYTPNLMAQRLQKRTTDTIGLILPVLSPRNADPFFNELLAGITHEATQQGFDLLVSTGMPGANEEAAYHRLVDSRRVDGLIIARPRWQDARLTLLQQSQFPHVVVGGIIAAPPTLAVADDIQAGMQAVVDHLAQQGHEKIALVNTPAELIASTDGLNGFQTAMAQANLTVEDHWIETAEAFTQKSGYQAGQRLLNRSEPPTAIVVADDVIALGVMNAVQNQGFEVGHDIAVTGYGDIILAEHAQPPLTTVQRPTYTLGQQACRQLITSLQRKPLPCEQLVLKPSLVIRQSSDLTLWL